MPRKLNKIDTFAQTLIGQQGRSIYPGEYEYVAYSSRLILMQIEKYFEGTGAQPPAPKTVKNWFYGECPHWAIAILAHATKS